MRARHTQPAASQSPAFSDTLLRRPLFVIAVFFALGVVLGRYVHIKAAYLAVAALFTAAAFGCGLLKKQSSLNPITRKLGVLMLAGAAALFAASFLSSCAYDASYIKTGESMQVNGRVYSEPYINDYGSTVCLLDEVYIDGQAARNVKLYVTEENDIACGDVVSAAADVEIPKGVRNPGGFDERLYLLSQGISYKAYAKSAEVMGSKGGLKVALSNARTYLGGVLDTIFDDETAPVAKAMLLGDKEGMDEKTYTAFKDTGMAHILAVSGLHAAMLIGAVYAVLKLLKVGRTARLAAALAFIALYTCVTGLTPSIVRAAIMAGALLIGTHFGKQNDTLNYLSLAFILSLLIRPLDLFSAGFQLSFAAVFGMLTIGWQIRRLWAKAFKNRLPRTGNAISASAGASAGTVPLLASAFGKLPTLSIFINLIIIPLAGAATVLVFAAAIIGAALGSAAAFAAYPASLVIKLMLLIIKAAANIPFAAFNVASPPLYLTISFFIAMYAASKYFLTPVRIKAALSGAAAVISIAALLLFRFSGLYIVFLDTGQSDAAFLRTEQGGEYFIDGGNEASAREIISFTVRNGCSPKAAFVSHTDTDHFSGIKALYEEGLLNKVYCSWQEKDVVEEAMPLAKVVPLGAGDTVWLDEHTKALVLYPYRDGSGENKNEMSLVVMIEYKGKRALFTGDISGVTETEVFASLPPVDIYKAAHHGSKYSSYRLPLSVIRPDYSVICVGKNRYGQPSPLAETSLSDYSGALYTTLCDCAIEFYISGDIKVNTYGGGE